MPYFFSSPIQGQQPYLSWTAATTPPTSTAMENVILPQIFTVPPSSFTSGPFTLSQLTNTSNQTYYQLSASGTDITTFDDTAIRSNLRDDVQTFLLAIENMGLVPGALPIVQQSLAMYLPLTFTETLFYRYGLDPVASYVDLQPGMRLRVDFQAYQMVSPTQPALNGFVGAGTTTIEVVEQTTSAGSITIGFDPLLSSIVNPQVLPNIYGGGGSGAIDLHNTSMAFPYYRLFYPSTFPAADSIGSAVIANNVVLFGTTTLANLESATQSYLQNGVFPTPQTPGIVAWFRGRTVVTPEIMVTLHGVPQWVTLGTTFRQILRRFAAIPRLDPTSIAPNFPSSLPTFSRWMVGFFSSGVAPNTQAIWTFPAAAPGYFFFAAPGNKSYYQYYSSTLDSFDLPLVGGDNILFGSSFPTGT